MSEQWTINKSTVEHVPVIYTIQTNANNDGWPVADCCGPKAKEHAEYIVRACESHEDLVKACERGQSWLIGQVKNLTHSKPKKLAKTDLVFIKAAIKKAGSKL